MNTDEEKLLEALSALSKRGPLEQVGRGGNSVGKTFQKALGIKHSTTTRNSLFNYVINATTSAATSGGRTNLFACVPDWRISKLKSSKELVKEFGREDISRGYSKSLFCTSTSIGPNGFGLVLKVDALAMSLEEWHASEGIESPVVAWDVTRLQSKLESLKKTAIITALPIIQGNRTAYHYRYVDLLEGPEVVDFFDLLENGSITIDHCISIKVGANSAREQGPLFKIRADCRSDLYKSIKRYDLMDL
jgi:hypothetical protein